MGGAANAALGHDDDEEGRDSIEMTLPKKDISAICKSLKKALGAEEDSEEEDASEEEAEDTRIFSDEEEGNNDVSKTLEYSRNEISNRLSNALNSLEEFDIKKARAVLKNLIDDL